MRWLAPAAKAVRMPRRKATWGVDGAQSFTRLHRPAVQARVLSGCWSGSAQTHDARHRSRANRSGALSVLRHDGPCPTGNGRSGAISSDQLYCVKGLEAGLLPRLQRGSRCAKPPHRNGRS
jgi:hypothetical protein